MGSVTLRFEDSPLLREAMHEGRFDVFEFFDHGAYPEHGAHKEEAERLVAQLTAGWDEAAVHRILARNAEYPSAWVPERLEAATTTEDQARLAAFAELQWLIDDGRAALHLDAFGLPRADQPLWEQLPDVFKSLSRDGLVPVGPDNATDAGGDEVAFCVGDAALMPHPHLRPMRELLQLLAALAAEGRLQVHVAVDPYRILALENVECRLLLDYWSGLQLTPGNLDSLDDHDLGTSFHAAVGRNVAQEFFNPMVATVINWARRGDNPTDPVKRLYVRELVPPRSRRGAELEAVVNRELHAERDTARRAFVHLDGKVRRYPTATYAVDHHQPRGSTGSASHSCKLWRVDGPITDTEWGELVGLHFRGNELVAEHFQATFPGMPAAE
jgi:hypothetical protein